ncbi:hypothetical protein J6590_049205, partial [Homalodisca vitripennis]
LHAFSKSLSFSTQALEKSRFEGKETSRCPSFLDKNGTAVNRKCVEEGVASEFFRCT